MSVEGAFEARADLGGLTIDLRPAHTDPWSWTWAFLAASFIAFMAGTLSSMVVLPLMALGLGELGAELAPFAMGAVAVIAFVRTFLCRVSWFRLRLDGHRLVVTPKLPGFERWPRRLLSQLMGTPLGPFAPYRIGAGAPEYAFPWAAIDAVALEIANDDPEELFIVLSLEDGTKPRIAVRRLWLEQDGLRELVTHLDRCAKEQAPDVQREELPPALRALLAKVG